MKAANGSNDSRGIGLLQQRFQREEFRASVRALLMTPLMGPAHEDFAGVRRQAEALREWFSRETGWILQVEREGARLYKRPGDLADAMRGIPGYDRRRYVLLCLACAVLERADPQITLRLLGERLLELAAEPTLDFTFTLEAQHERRELVSVCRTLLGLGVLHRVAGDEETFVRAGGDQADALYDVQRRTLAGMLAAVRGPSTWAAQEAPVTLKERLRALIEEHVADSEEGRRTALRHQLARRLLDDPVVYVETLDTEARAYFFNQRGAMAARLCEAAGLVAEQRAEGLALVDEAGVLTDVAMPAEGTDAHVTLLVAEHLATGQRQGRADGAGTAQAAGMREHDIADFLHEAKGRYGRYWRKSAREPGAERELAAIAIDRLEKLQLVVRMAGVVQPLPALARFALGEAEIRETRSASTKASGPLFEPTGTTA
ncbi:TIGR02678 family protein [Mesorhizobium sp. IMUNJ 23033]|uniref:TIGR02678 family protein n=1 Tax=Mesorhizobium sp. IMUNJ 23033 TaxID=3378039 RepID=UPI003850ED6E